MFCSAAAAWHAAFCMTALLLVLPFFQVVIAAAAQAARQQRQPAASYKGLPAVRRSGRQAAESTGAFRFYIICLAAKHLQQQGDSACRPGLLCCSGAAAQVVQQYGGCCLHGLVPTLQAAHQGRDGPDIHDLVIKRAA